MNDRQEDQRKGPAGEPPAEKVTALHQQDGTQSPGSAAGDANSGFDVDQFIDEHVEEVAEGGKIVRRKGIYLL